MVSILASTKEIKFLSWLLLSPLSAAASLSPHQRLTLLLLTLQSLPLLEINFVVANFNVATKSNCHYLHSLSFSLIHSLYHLFSINRVFWNLTFTIATSLSPLTSATKTTKSASPSLSLSLSHPLPFSPQSIRLLWNLTFIVVTSHFWRLTLSLVISLSVIKKCISFCCILKSLIRRIHKLISFNVIIYRFTYILKLRITSNTWIYITKLIYNYLNKVRKLNLYLS